MENKTLYTKQKNYCTSLLKKSKKKYFANLNEKDILDKNKLIWKAIKVLITRALLLFKINSEEKTQKRGNSKRNP